MLQETFLALLQAATEFLPVSSSGHLALVSNILGEPDLFFFTVLHIASLFAVLIFTRKEIKLLLTFNKRARQFWMYLIIATIPAGLFGFFFNNFIESTFSSFLALAIAFAFTGFILLATKDINPKRNLSLKSVLVIGLLQAVALFPGISRSGMTISAGLFSGVNRKTATRFSFLLFIPLSIGAFVLESSTARITTDLVLPFIVCFFASLAFLHLLTYIIERGKFWVFSFYCFALAILSLVLYLV